MADRFPLILNTNANQIQEIASGDSLDLTGSNITNAGIITANNVTIGAATTDLVVTGDARITGILTIGTSSLKLDGPNNLVNVGTALTLGHTQGLQFHTQNLHSTGFEVNQINASGIITATQADINGDLDVDGHTNLDNISVAGVTTFSDDITFTGTNYTGAIWDKSDDSIKLNDNTRLKLGSGFQDFNARHDGTYTWLQNSTGPLLIDCSSSYIALISGNNLAGGKMARFIHNGAAELYHDNTKRLETSSVGVSIPQDLDVGGHTNLDNVSIAGVTTITQDLDVDGHTNLDNVSVAGVSTFTGAINGSSAAFTGNVSIGGTLTYEDVSNIDSVGIVTARSGLVSPNADIDDFISVGSNIHLGNAGVVTATTFSGSGASLTNLNGSNIASGTVPVARIGTGTKNSSTFYRGDGTFAVVTSVGGNTGVDFNDSVKARFGTGNDLEIFHDGTSSEIKNHVGDSDLNITCTGQGTLTLGVETSSGSNYKGISLHYLGRLEPRVHDSIDLGSSSKRFKTAYLDVAQVDSQVKTNTIQNNTSADVFIRQYGATDHIKFRQGSSQSDGWNIQTGGHFVPSNNNAYDIGQTSSRVRNGYFTTVSAGSSISVGTGVTIESNGQATYVGIVTASAFKLSDGSAVGGLTSDAQNNTVGGTDAGDNFDGNALYNTIIGAEAGTDLTNGNNNALYGFRAGWNITTGSDNICMGTSSGRYLVTQSNNILIGKSAGDYLGYNQGAPSSGSGNVVIGYEAGAETRVAHESVYIGKQAGRYVTTGNYNIGIGYYANRGAYNQAGGSYNVCMGNNTGESFTTGHSNVVIGYQAGDDINSGAYNVCLGREAGHGATGAGGAVAIGYRAGYNGLSDYQVAIGYEAAYNGGNYGIALGYAALKAQGNAQGNIGIGHRSAEAVTGNHNTVIGRNACYTGTNNLTSGTNNTVIGYNAETSSATVSNEITLGNSSITTFRVPGIGFNASGTGHLDVTGNSARFRTIESGGATVEIRSGGSEGYVGTSSNHKVSLITNSTRRWEISGAGHLIPYANDTYDIGSSSYRVRDIYTGDLNLSNVAKKDKGGNDVDGTWGDFTIQEGESDLFLINNRSGKKYKFNLTEVS